VVVVTTVKFAPLDCKSVQTERERCFSGRQVRPARPPALAKRFDFFQLQCHLYETGWEVDNFECLVLFIVKQIEKLLRRFKRRPLFN
jgi:hypothetical protein